MHRPLKIFLALTSLTLLSACSVFNGPATPAPIAQIQASEDALGRWPEVAPDQPGLKRPFFATMHIAGHRITASGVLDYHNPRDFRLTAVSEVGSMLFDARYNWAGITVLRKTPELDDRLIHALLLDMSKSLQPPDSLADLSVVKSSLVLYKKQADLHRYTWTFDPPSGRLRDLSVDLGPFDTLHTEYLSYNAFGWPEELTLTHKSRDYSISFSFTDDHVAQRDWHGNSQ